MGASDKVAQARAMAVGCGCSHVRILNTYTIKGYKISKEIVKCVCYPRSYPDLHQRQSSGAWRICCVGCCVGCLLFHQLVVFQLVEIKSRTATASVLAGVPYCTKVTIDILIHIVFAAQYGCEQLEGRDVSLNEEDDLRKLVLPHQRCKSKCMQVELWTMSSIVAVKTL